MLFFAPALNTEDAQTCCVSPAYSTNFAFNYLMSIQFCEEWEEICVMETNIVIENIYYFYFFLAELFNILSCRI